VQHRDLKPTATFRVRADGCADETHGFGSERLLEVVFQQEEKDA
jgi:hypothetical protein